MTKSIVAALAATLLTGTAFAADLPIKAAPDRVISPSWTGFYVNAGAGYGVWSADTTTIIAATGAPDLPLVTKQGGNGWLGRLGAGYDYQLAPTWVFGVFGDYDFASLKGNIQDQNPYAVADAREKWAWAAGARAGYLVTPQILSYVNGGYTEAHFTSGPALNNNAGGAPLGWSYNSITANGWFIGGGAEVAVIPNLTWRTEYRLASYGTENFVTNPALAADSITFKPRVQTVTSGLVYKFNWGR